ncbi:MAG: M14 metallopeptidase family protein [Bacteroidota bacterium]
MTDPYLTYKVPTVKGRYVTLSDLDSFREAYPEVPWVILGKSVEEQNIYGVFLGEGERKVLAWSQMHGNESTTTKAVLDLFHFLTSDNALAKEICAQCRILVLPMVNPDGAERYTRANANSVDLNRDAKEQTQPESEVLRYVYDSFKPDFCFNLHDQRTLFSAGKKSKPATLSFLSPSEDEARTVTDTRKTAMGLIAGMVEKLNTEIPNQIGRYDDGFNDNCIGDSLQMAGTPTILFEAGHFPNDYEREETRKYVFQAMVEALHIIAQDQVEAQHWEDYFDIPENEKLFYDIILENIGVLNPKFQKKDVIGVRFEEQLKRKKIHFIPKCEKLEAGHGYFAHKVLDCSEPADLEDLKKNASFFKALSKQLDTLLI